MYYIAYTIIGIGLGGIVFLLLKKLPRFFSKGEAEFETLLRKEEQEKSWFENISFGLPKKLIKKLPFRASKEKFLDFFRKIKARLGNWVDKTGKFLKNGFQKSSTWLGTLKEKVNLNLKGLKKEDNQKPQEQKDQTPEPREEFEQQEEFFSELLGEREKEEKSDEKAETTTDSSQETAEQKVSKSAEQKTQQQEELRESESEDEKKKNGETRKDSGLSQEEKEIQRWIEKLKEEPKNGKAYMELGFIYFDKGQKKKAKSCLESAEKLGVDKGRVQEVLSKIESNENE